MTKADHSKSFDTKQYLYAQPVDICVRKIVDLLDSDKATANVSFDNCYLLNRDDYSRALKLTSMCTGARTFPLRLNMGIWYFCLQVVADATRLQSLLRTNSVKPLDKEMRYVGFLVKR